MNTMNAKPNSLLRLLHAHLTYRKGMEMTSGDKNTGFVLARIRHTGAVTFFRFIPLDDEMVLIQRRVYNTGKMLMTETTIIVSEENAFDRIAHY